MEIRQLLSYTFFQHALLAALLMAISCGIIGTYLVTRRMVFISGGITHASFGGIGLGYFAGFPPLAGAALVAVLAALGSENLTRRKVLRNDSIIAILWSMGMAIGIIFIYLSPGYAPDLMSYLFGSILTVSASDLYLMGILAVVVSLVFIFFYRSILYVAFDEEFARSRGIPVMLINYAIIILVALTIVLSIRTAGIILVLAVLTIPQNIINLYSKRFRVIMFGSILVGLAASLSGLAISYFLNIPSGATIIFTLALFYLVARLIKVLTFGK